MNDLFCDSHFHVGRFHNYNATPAKINKIVNALNIKQIAVSSLSACTESYVQLKKEHLELEALLPGRVLSILWLSPQFLKKRGWDSILNSGIKWKGLKVHGLQHKPDNSFYNRVVEIAKHYSFPVIIHTGGSAETDAGAYRKIIEKNNSVTFILAHGRPISDTLDILHANDNVWVDTSFMPLENITLLLDKGLSKKIVYGSDYPAFKYFYHDVNELDYMRSRISEIRMNSDGSSFRDITCMNFQRVFNGNHD